MTSIQDIEDIVARCVARDPEAFNALYVHLIDRVYAYVRSRTNTKTDAVDITQDTFIDLYQALENFDFTSLPQFYSFVFTITKRKLAKHYEATKDRRIRETELDEETLVHSEIEEKESDDMLNRALHTLPETAREIVILHHWSRYTFGEIATLLNMNESAVRVRHHRALKELAHILDINPVHP